jgi:membrane-associated two-gene conflict system component 1 (EACC1)
VSICLSVEGDNPVSGLEELSDWLRREPELRGLLTPADARPASGELGAAAEVLVAAVGGGGALSVLAASLRSFLSLPRRSDVRIVVLEPSGRSVKVDAKNVRDVEALIREILGQNQ